MSDVVRPTVRVVAAALYDTQGRVLLAERPAGKHMAGWWEFPGGKVHSGESDRAALVRELREELGIEAQTLDEFMTIRHVYDDRDVDLVLWLVHRYVGEPRGLDAQQLKWVACEALGEERILEADRPFVDALRRQAAAAR